MKVFNVGVVGVQRHLGRLVVIVVVVCGGVGMGGGVGCWWGGVVVWAVEAVGGGHVGSKKELRASGSAAEPANCV